MTESPLSPFDAVVLMSFGGPEGPDDILPFLKNVTAGRGIPEERLKEVGEHYYMFDGVSPINEQNIALLQQLEGELERRGITTPILWGNRNWDPFLTDTIRAHHERTGATKFLAITTSAYSSYSSCRQYREDFGATVDTLKAEGIDVTFNKVRQYYNHPGFVNAQVQIMRHALVDFEAKVGELDPQKHRILYVTHSIPTSMQEASEVATAGYADQHLQLMNAIDQQLDDSLPHELVFCSRSGPPHVPWLEPDVNDRMEKLASQGITGVIVAPIGFVSDHMEVKYDLDVEAAETAERVGLAYERAATVGTNPAFVMGLVDLLEEKAAQVRGEEPHQPALTPEGPVDGCTLAQSGQCCKGRVEKPVMP